jgi:RNA polymerase subunit RPABC4/transcription elongation factor Spt4/TM2 domain-containing membrane protein YozV
MSADTDHYCRACGERVARDAEICSNCGVGAGTVDVGSETVYCRDCGEELRAAAEICPECGVRQRPPPSTVGSVESDLESFFYRNRGLVAAVASFLLPGLGQLLNREITKGLLVFGALVVASVAVVFGVGLLLVPLVYVYAVYDAYRTGRALERGNETETERPHA